jgi:hypothetical protein
MYNMFYLIFSKYTYTYEKWKSLEECNRERLELQFDINLLSFKIQFTNQ